MAGPSAVALSVLNNSTAVRSPLLTDDASAGYSVGSRWLYAATRDEWRCVDATVGAAVWVQVDVLDHGGYVAGNWYLPVQTPQSTAGTNAGIGVITLIPGIIKQKITVNALGLRVSTLANGGNVQAAIYRNKDARPGALIAGTASMSTAAVASVSAAPGQGTVQLEPGIYWFAVSSDNATSALLAVIATAANPILGALLGSTSQTLAMTAQGFGGYSTPGTFGTWPSDLTGAPLTELTSARAGVVGLRVASVP